MVILITGNKGYIGSRLQKRIEKAGHAVIGLDLKDGLDVLSAYPLPHVDLVYHLAAQSGAIPSQRDPLWDARANILGTIKIALHYRHTKIVFPTSGAATDPKSPYGLSKQTAEKYLDLIAKNAVICRLSSIYGDKPRGVVDNFIKQGKCTVYGDGSAERDFVHVKDIVEGLWKAKEWEAGHYSLGSGKGVSIKEVAEATGKEIDYQPERGGELKRVVLPNTTPNWKPKNNVLDYVRTRC